MKNLFKILIGFLRIATFPTEDEILIPKKQLLNSKKIDNAYLNVLKLAAAESGYGIDEDDNTIKLTWLDENF